MPRGICLILFFSLLLQQCANQTQPTGGPKDETPPGLLSTIPADGTTNFTDTEIRLLFDEDVTLKNAKNQILITPRTDVNYDIKVRRSEVILTFDSLLDANTTYTINFRESIQDLTEGNPAERLRLAFSTGPNLDSLTLGGNIYRVRDGEIPEVATVVLYKISDTTDLFTGLPYYYTQTTDSGKFQFTNLKDGYYKLYAFQDYNNNLKAEYSKEPYGFLPDTLNITDSLNRKISLPLVNLDLGDLKLLSSRQSGSIYLNKYNKNLASFTVFSTDSIPAQLDPTDLSVLQFYPVRQYTASDSSFLVSTVTDSLGQQKTDTLYASFNSESTRKSDYSARVDIREILVRDPVINVQVTFNKPSVIANPDSLYVFIDSLVSIPADSMLITWNSLQTTANLSYRLDKSLFTAQPQEATNDRRSSGARPYFRLGTNSFRSIQYDSIKGRSLQLSFLRDQDLANLIIHLDTNVPNYFIELINDSEEVIRTIPYPKNKTININNIPPGQYAIRAIIDRNNNGRWDPGNYRDNTPPEIIKYFIQGPGNKMLDLRANFTVEETFNF